MVVVSMEPDNPPEGDQDSTVATLEVQIGWQRPTKCNQRSINGSPTPHNNFFKINHTAEK